MEPYRIFFPISLVGAVAGVFLWILAWIVQKHWIDYPFNPYPIIHHINIMSALFLVPVLKGFVFTAIPRFTGTEFLKKREIQVLVSLQILIVMISFFMGHSVLFYSLQSLDLAFLFFFILYRFKFSKVKLSSYLNFLIAGVFLGLIGSILQLGSLFFTMGFLFQMGKDFIFYGTIPAVIFGVGTRFISMIVNTENPNTRMEWLKKAEKPTSWIQILFVISFFLELGLSQFLQPSWKVFLRGIRFIICSYWMILYFHIFEWKSFRTKLPRTILFSCFMFLIGLGGYSFGLDYSAHLAHIYLIGGITLLIAGIMTRVTLSHGGGDMSIEKNSSVFYWIGGLLFVAAITRGFVFLYPNLTTSHLAYAAILYIIAVFLWLGSVGHVIFKSR